MRRLEVVLMVVMVLAMAVYLWWEHVLNMVCAALGALIIGGFMLLKLFPGLGG